MELTNESTDVPLPEAPPVNPEHLKPRKKAEAPYMEIPLAKAQKFLTDRGFLLQEGNTQQFQTAVVYHYTNPHTGQRANLSHKSRDKRGRPIDEAKIAFHLMVQPKRRTPEQKARDNFVFYD